eukprot:5689879-Amphidinium_carterae.1
MTAYQGSKVLATTYFRDCSPASSNCCGSVPPSKLWPRETTCGISDDGTAPVEASKQIQTQHLKFSSKIDSNTTCYTRPDTMAFKCLE